MAYLPVTYRQEHAALKRKTSEVVRAVMNGEAFPVETTETGTALSITADLTGLNYADASVKMHANRVVIEVALHADLNKDPSHLIFVRRECPFTTSVDLLAAALTLQDNHLRVTLPKTRGNRLRRQNYA